MVAAARVPLLVHCELMTVEELDAAAAAARARDTPRSFASFLESRPAE